MSKHILFRKAAGRGSDAMVGGWMVVELWLNNCNTRLSFSCEPGNTHTMLSPLKWSILRVRVGGGV